MKLTTLKSRVGTQGARLATLTPDSWRADKQTSTQRGYGYKWQQAREGHLRSHPLCVYCEREDRVTAATVVDHAIPHRGDQELFWQRSNWQSMCKSCHDVVKQREERALRDGRTG